MPFSSFLRTVLKLDAACCMLMAALFLSAAGPLSRLLGTPPAVLTESGIVLAAVGAFIGWLGTRRQGMPALVGLVVAGNVGWVAASLLSLALLLELTAVGVAAILAQAVAVLTFAALEWRGLRGSAIPATA
jgi:hypothetical protein